MKSSIATLTAGMNVEHGVEAPKGKIHLGDFAEFAGDWNKYCTRDKMGVDITATGDSILKILP